MICDAMDFKGCFDFFNAWPCWVVVSRGPEGSSVWYLWVGAELMYHIAWNCINTGESFFLFDAVKYVHHHHHHHHHHPLPYYHYHSQDDSSFRNKTLSGNLVKDTSKSDGQFKKTASNKKLRGYKPDFKFTPIKESWRTWWYWWRWRWIWTIPHPGNYTPEVNIATQKWWLEDYFPFGMAYFQGLC